MGHWIDFDERGSSLGLKDHSRRQLTSDDPAEDALSVDRHRTDRTPQSRLARRGAETCSCGSEKMDKAGKVKPVERRSAGRLVLITGLPGSGKTTLAMELATSMPACRMCPDDWMIASGIDLWDSSARARIEAFQLSLSLDVLRSGSNVVIEWGTWGREERDAVRDAARSVGAPVELRCLDVDAEELWRRIVDRDLEGRWGSRSVRRHEVDEWVRAFPPPTYDGQKRPTS